MEIIEPASAVLGSPGAVQGGHGFARGLGGRVLAACGVPGGREGTWTGAARLHDSRPSRKPALSGEGARADLAKSAAHARQVFFGMEWAKGPKV